MLDPGTGTSGVPAAAGGRIGVLLVNLGTPDGTGYWPVRRYLAEFLWDRRVIETARLPWWLILHGLVLPRRPFRSGRAYAKIWDRERNESPIKTITREQCDGIAEALERFTELHIDWAMRYGSPSMEERILALTEAGCDRILLFPLYPQYSATSTASVQDKAFDVLKGMRLQPAIRTVPAFYDHPLYIEATCANLKCHLDSLAWEAEVVLVSFHGLPKRNIELGDPYLEQCYRTLKLMKGRMGPDGDKLEVVFQSRFGREEWLQPYAEARVRELARSGARNVVVVAPGFVADCLETLEELSIGLQEVFEEEGGENFSTVPCLNYSEGARCLFAALIQSELAGWLRE
ncbi:MAG: ferrochelatase [Anaerolineaceae bacterium]|nr:ferrochelatase [Anaerolineaceae bacterium]